MSNRGRQLRGNILLTNNMLLLKELFAYIQTPLTGLFKTILKMLLLLLLLLYHRALFDHVSFEKGDVSAFLHYRKCDPADFSVIIDTVISDQDV